MLILEFKNGDNMRLMLHPATTAEARLVNDLNNQTGEVTVEIKTAMTQPYPYFIIKKE